MLLVFLLLAFIPDVAGAFTVTGVLAVAGIISVASIPDDPSDPVLGCVFTYTVLYSEHCMYKETYWAIVLWLSKQTYIFFCYRTIYVFALGGSPTPHPISLPTSLLYVNLVAMGTPKHFKTWVPKHYSIGVP